MSIIVQSAEKRAQSQPANRAKYYLILVTGSREWPAERKEEIAVRLRAEVEKAKRADKIPVLVHGNSWGADSLAHHIATKELKIMAIKCFAAWAGFGTKAGPIRNSMAADLFEFDAVLAFPLPSSKGTHDMVKKARLKGA